MKISAILLLCVALSVPASALADTYQYSGSFTTAPITFVFDTNGLITSDITVATTSCSLGALFSSTDLPCDAITIDPDDNNLGGIETGTISFYEKGVLQFSLDGRPTYLFDTVGSTQFGPVDFMTITDLSTPSATPEPSSLVLLGTGALGFVGMVRRRFRAV